jgi:glycosyltransferase involved in cell wall biosynthesis
VKWAIFIPRILSEKDGGTRVYVDRFAGALLESGHEVHIFTTSLDDSLPEHDEEKGAAIHRTFVRAGTAGPLRVTVATRVTRQFNEVDKREHFDVINLHSAYLLRYGMLRRRHLIMQTVHAVVTYEYLFTVKKVVSSLIFSLDGLKELLSFPVKLPVSYVREWTSIRRADAVVVMSEYVRGTIRRFFPWVKKDDVFISRIGIDTADYAPSRSKAETRCELGLTRNEIVLMTARRLAPRMGLENLIAGFCRSASENSDVKMRLIIAGRGPLRERLARLIRDCGMADAITLLGFIPDEKLLQYYHAADVFVLPTEQLEGFGIVSLEALASNLPVIATPVGANPEVVGPVCPELMTASGSPADITEKIDYFVGHRSAYDGKDYRSVVKRDYSWGGIVEEIEGLLSVRAPVKVSRR